MSSGSDTPGSRGASIRKDESTSHPLLGRWTPGGLALPERVPGDLDQAAAIGVHLAEVSILVRLGQGATREDDLRPLRRSGRTAAVPLAR